MSRAGSDGGVFEGRGFLEEEGFLGDMRSVTGTVWVSGLVNGSEDGGGSTCVAGAVLGAWGECCACVFFSCWSSFLVFVSGQLCSHLRGSTFLERKVRNNAP